MAVDEAVKLSVKAVNTAMKRDIFSGEGVNVVIIDKNGYRMLDEKEVAKHTTK